MTQSPSFTGHKPASEASSRAKRANRAVDTKHERVLRSELWQMGLRYRKNVKTLLGKPDIVFPSAKVAVFCDGDFWHGRDWPDLKKKLKRGTNPVYWQAKIKSNITRDKRNTAILEKMGWTVIRLWATDIEKDPTRTARYVRKVVNACKRKKNQV